MKTMIPRTYNDIMTLAGLQQLRQYCMISEETEANLFESFASGKLRLAEVAAVAAFLSFRHSCIGLVLAQR